VAEFLPHFVDRVHEALATVLGEEEDKKITIGLAKDGSGVGAALTALTAKIASERRQ
jgi:hexokinase